jgi:hypothetical protein
MAALSVDVVNFRDLELSPLHLPPESCLFASLPLDRPRRLAGHIVDRAVHSLCRMASALAAFIANRGIEGRKEGSFSGFVMGLEPRLRDFQAGLTCRGQPGVHSYADFGEGFFRRAAECRAGFQVRDIRDPSAIVLGPEYDDSVTAFASPHPRPRRMKAALVRLRLSFAIVAPHAPDLLLRSRVPLPRGPAQRRCNLPGRG